eukprot:10571077-Ditylum_brightwellii.AAC.1
MVFSSVLDVAPKSISGSKSTLRSQWSEKGPFRMERMQLICHCCILELLSMSYDHCPAGSEPELVTQMTHLSRMTDAVPP